MASTSNSQWRYDVFLSFRGEDTRKNFTAHLSSALDRANIETFIDDEELPRGEEIAPQLLNAIDGSRIALIVFSKTYAHSKWCLDELVKIMECQEEKGQKVFPIFYHVEPSEVRNQTGTYGEAFKNHKINADEEKKKKIEEWRTALRKAGNLGGFDLQDRSEAKFIEEIIGEIRRLIPKVVHVGENIVGLYEKLKAVKSLIDPQPNKVSMVGIYGIGGIGKTTIAKAVYNDMLHQFERHSFIENVREKSKGDCGVLKLQEKLLCDIRMEKDLKLDNVDEGIERIRKCKHDFGKVLIVLDDVDGPKKLDFFAPESEWFHPGSIIIVTTRNKRCSDVHKSYLTYEAKGLAHDRAMELFSWNAFKQRNPKEKYVGLSNRILRYAKGHPLALVVLGSLLDRDDVEFWESTLDKLKTKPLDAIQTVLQISYDELDRSCKELFLDIACFFKDDDEKFVKRILEGSGTHPKSGLRTLSERCLISIIGGTITMHDLLQEMGWAIVRQNNPNHPGKWSRLWEYNDIKSVFTKNMGTENIEGIFLDCTAGKPIQLTTEEFRKMKCLRLLRVKDKMTHLSPDFELPCHDLTYFHWERYPLESMPSNFHADNLVELNLPSSSIRHLWKGNMDATKLKVIDLSFSEHLVDISSISSVPNLVILILKGCKSLESLPGNLQELKCLQTLSCDGCSKIGSFPDIKQGNLGRLRDLDLSETGIKELPSSIRHLHGLQYLDLSFCENLESLPGNLQELKCLRTLCCFGCSKIGSFPDIKQGNLGRLRELDLSETGIKELPSSIRHLHGLQYLDLRSCENLESLPGLPDSFCSVRSIDLENCPRLGVLTVRLWFDSRSFSVTCRILKSGVVWDNKSYSSLKSLNSQCEGREEEILNYICPLSSLLELSRENSYWNKRDIQPPSLQISSLKNFHLLKGGILSDIFHLSSLVELSICNCNLMEVEIPHDIRNLSSLKCLSLSNCNIMKGESLNHICHLSSLERLSLDGNHFTSVPAGISRLSNLRGLDLSHCKNLLQIPELPSSLGFLDAHCSDGISSSPSFLPIHSLVSSFKWINQFGSISLDCSTFDGHGIGIVIPRSSGILEQIRCQRMVSDEVAIKLPPNWYEDDDLLGFALCGVYEFDFQYNYGSVHPSASEHMHRYDCDYDEINAATRFWLGHVDFGLGIRENIQSIQKCDFTLFSLCVSEYESDMVWVISYPKVAAIMESYVSSQLTHFLAKFRGAKECGFRLIYAKEYEQKHQTMAQGNTSHGNFGEHGCTIEDTNSKAHNKRNPTKQSPVEESHHKRFRGTLD